MPGRIRDSSDRRSGVDVGGVPLMRNEAVLADVNPSWTSYTWLLAFAALVLLGGIVETAVGDDAAGAAITGIVLCSLFVGYVYWKRSKTHYVVTDQRVVKRTGLLRTNVQEAAYGAISAVNTEQGTLQSLFGDGTVRIGTTTGAGAIELRGVPSHHELATLVRQRHPTLSSRGAPPAGEAPPPQQQSVRQPRAPEQRQQGAGVPEGQPPRQQDGPDRQERPPREQRRPPARDEGGRREQAGGRQRRTGAGPDRQPQSSADENRQPADQRPHDGSRADRGAAGDEPAAGASAPDRGDPRASDDEERREDDAEKAVEDGADVEETGPSDGGGVGDEGGADAGAVTEDETGEGEADEDDGDVWRVD
jgi:membrane protein YdbS with pleckstrin-like domain